MAFLQCEVESKSLVMPTSVYAVLPHDNKGFHQVRGVIYLLHGRGQGAFSWMRWTSVERYCAARQLAVIMPDVGRSFYTDMQFGQNYFTYLSEELPALCESIFRIENVPSSTYVFGLSMGGYGALKCALNHPGRYAGCAAFSAMPDIRYRIANTPVEDPKHRELQGIFGVDLIPGEADDLYRLAERLPADQAKPRLLITCGTEDPLYPLNTAFSAHLNRTGYPHQFLDWPGVHDWKFWDESFVKAMEFFFD